MRDGLPLDDHERTMLRTAGEALETLLMQPNAPRGLRGDSRATVHADVRHDGGEAWWA